jgi:hypothetical protein
MREPPIELQLKKPQTRSTELLQRWIAAGRSRDCREFQQLCNHCAVVVNCTPEQVAAVLLLLDCISK